MALRVPRHLASLMVVLLIALVSVVLSPAHAAVDISDVGERTFSTIAGCAASADSVLVAIVVDESSSLRINDPNDLRVGAIVAAVDSLTSVQEAGGVRVSVEANLATFSGEYSEIVGWGAVEDGHAAALLDAAQNQLPSRDAGSFTNYSAALVGAQRSLENRHAELGGTACKLVLWFTDGQLDVPGNGEPQALAQLCDPLGIIDNIRGAGIAIVTVALFTDQGSATVGQAQREELRAIAEGTGAGVQCGQPVSADAGPGAYLRADDPGALRRLFAGVGARIEGGTSASSVLCPADECPGGSLDIPLDAGVAGFRAIIDARPGVAPSLVAPGGQQMALDSSSTETLDGASVRIDARDGLTILSVTSANGGAGNQPWIIHSGASQQAPDVIDLYYFWGVTLSADAPNGLVIGEPSSVEVRAWFADGTPVDPAVYQRFQLSLQASGVEVPLEPLSDGVAAATITVPAGSVASSTGLTAVAEATTTAHQISLGPVRTTTSVQTSLPAAFPALQTATLTFPTLTGDSTSSRSTLSFLGSERGPTQACWAPGQLAGPGGAGGIDVTSDQDCVVIPANETVNWEFGLSAANPADGQIQGSVILTLHAVDNQEAIDVEVPVVGSMVRPVDEPLRWELTAALIALALLIAGAIIVVFNLLTGFRIGPRTKIAEVPVVLSADGLQRMGGTPMFKPDDFHFHNAARDQRVPSAHLGGLHFFRKLPYLGLGEPTAWVKGDPGEFVVSTYRRATGPADGSRAPVDFGLGSNLYLALSRTTTQGGGFSGRLVTVADDQPDLMKAQAGLVASNHDIWSATFERLNAQVTAPLPRPKPEGEPPHDGSNGYDDGPPPVFGNDSGEVLPRPGPGLDASADGPPEPRRSRRPTGPTDPLSPGRPGAGADGAPPVWDRRRQDGPSRPYPPRQPDVVTDDGPPDSLFK